MHEERGRRAAHVTAMVEMGEQRRLVRRARLGVVGEQCSKRRHEVGILGHGAFDELLEDNHVTVLGDVEHAEVTASRHGAKREVYVPARGTDRVGASHLGPGAGEGRARQLLERFEGRFGEPATLGWCNPLGGLPPDVTPLRKTSKQ